MTVPRSAASQALWLHWGKHHSIPCLELGDGWCPRCGCDAHWGQGELDPICLGDPSCSAEAIVKALLEEMTAPRRVVFSTMDLFADCEDKPTLGGIPDYPVESLPAAGQGLVKDAVRAGLPAALIGGAAIGAISAAVGANSRIDLLGGQRAILWVALIGAAGAGKSPAMQLALGPIREWDAQVDDDRRILLADLTLEALARELSVRDGGAALDLDELAILLRGLGEYKRGGGGDRGRFLSLWTGDHWSIVRVAGGGATNKLRIHIDRPTVTIIGALQPHLHELLGADEDGSRARWLPHLAKPTEPVGNVPTSMRPSVWDKLLAGLLDVRGSRRDWSLSEQAGTAFGDFRTQWKHQARGVETATVATALDKADIHLARYTLVLAEADSPGQGGLIGPEVVERAAAMVQFTLDCYRALPANGGLALSRKDETLDRSVERMRAWLEEHGGKASRRDLQRACVGGVKTGKDLDALIERYEATYPGAVSEERSTHGGRTTIIVSAPRRCAVPIVGKPDTGESREQNARRNGEFGDVRSPDIGGLDDGLPPESAAVTHPYRADPRDN